MPPCFISLSAVYRQRRVLRRFRSLARRENTRYMGAVISIIYARPLLINCRVNNASHGMRAFARVCSPSSPWLFFPISLYFAVSSRATRFSFRVRPYPSLTPYGRFEREEKCRALISRFRAVDEFLAAWPTKTAACRVPLLLSRSCLSLFTFFFSLDRSH